MFLEQALRNHWATHQPLTSLVPLARFWTGAAPPSAELPFVVLSKPLVETRLRTSAGRAIEDAKLRMTIVAAELDAAGAIAREIELRYEAETFALDDGIVLDTRRQRREESLTGDGVWQIALDFRALIERTTAAQE